MRYYDACCSFAADPHTSQAAWAGVVCVTVYEVTIFLYYILYI